MGQVAQVQWLPPAEDKQSTQGASFQQGIWWGISAAQGRRDSMEDTFLGIPDLGRPPDNSMTLAANGHERQQQPRAEWTGTSLFGVFDGHHGDDMSKFCEQSMARTIASQPCQDVQRALVESFHRVDQTARSIEHKGSGSTALVACVRQDAIFVANAGDCRAVLCRQGEAVEMSQDHKPSDDFELERIQNAGGWVEMESSQDADARVNGDLSVSRSIGDFTYKQDAARSVSEQIVIPTPDVEVFQRSRKDEFMIIASDGVWDVISSQDCVDWVRRKLGRTSDLEDRLNEEELNLSDIAEGLIDHCLAPRPGLLFGVGEDNMTVILIVFVKSYWADRTKMATPRV